MKRLFCQAWATRYRFAVVMAAFVGLLLVDAVVAHACPGCKQALATAEGEQANMVNGYFWSILFMLSMPFTLLGLFAGSMYLAVRKARNAAQPAQPAFFTSGP
jgi:heme/copper-type cytochrome/quinol oxidase subunit 2